MDGLSGRNVEAVVIETIGLEEAEGKNNRRKQYKG